MKHLPQLQLTRLITLVCALLFSCFASQVAATSRPIVIDNPALLAAAAQLPATGTLRQEDNGFVYLKVSDDFVNKLYPLLNDKTLYKDRNRNGAHITLITPANITKYNVPPITELGSEYPFKIEALYKITMRKCQKGQGFDKTWYVLHVDAPELMSLLNKYGIPVKKNYRLHITLAYQLTPNPQACAPRANRSFIPTFAPAPTVPAAVPAQAAIPAN